MIRKHIDFDLWIGLDDVKARCKGKEARAEIQLPLLEKEMEVLARALQQGSDSSDNDFGKRLYDAVFVKQVRDLMAVNLPQRGAKRGLRVRLRLHRKVSGWPWELLNTGNSFLAMSVKTPVVRDVDGNPLPVLRTAWPIRVLRNPLELRTWMQTRRWPTSARHWAGAKPWGLSRSKSWSHRLSQL